MVNQDLSRDDELKIENSRQITTIVTVLLPILVGVVGFVLVERVAGSLFWFAAVASGVILALSVLAGGVGVSRLRRGKKNRFSWFNAQAGFCVLGFILILASYPLTRAKGGELQVDANTEHRITDLEAQAADTLSLVKTLQADVISLRNQQDAFREELEQARQQLAATQRQPVQK